jgi:glycosidase
VPNFTSDEHEWFIKSVKREGRYADYYVWHDGRTDGSNIYPPNNWVGLVHVRLGEVLH